MSGLGACPAQAHADIADLTHQPLFVATQAMQPLVACIKSLQFRRGTLNVGEQLVYAASAESGVSMS